MFKTMMNWFFPKKIKLRDLVMENPPPPPVKKKVISLPKLPKIMNLGYQPEGRVLDIDNPPKGGSGVPYGIPWQMLPSDMLAMIKPIPPKSITNKEYFKGIPNA